MYKKGYKKSYPKKTYKSKKFTKSDRIRKLAGTQPQTAIQKIASGVGTVATIAKTVSGIVSMINVEDKYVDVNVSSSILNTGTALSVNLNPVAQGSGRDQRNGNKILCESLQFKFQLYLDPVSTTATMVKLVLIYDKKPQVGSVLGANNLYAPVTTTGLINKDSVGDRFVILKEWLYCLQPQGTRMICDNYYQKLDRMHIQWTGSGATAFETGAIYLIGISDASSSAPTIIGTSRFAYADN